MNQDAAERIKELADGSLMDDWIRKWTHLELADVHCHLCHGDYDHDRADLLKKIDGFGLRSVVVNGLEPISNRKGIELARSYPIVRPAAGIYPLDAIHPLIKDSYECQPFCIESEIGWIEDQAHGGSIVAVGECGLDGYYFGGQMIEAQKKVFAELIRIATQYRLPLIVHSRKAEKQVMELLAEKKISNVIFHCYMGKVSLALRGAEEYGWNFSIPAIAPRHMGFQKMLAQLPEAHVLTETDSPYLSQLKGARNDSRQVIYPIWTLAVLRGIGVEAATKMVWQNTQRIFDLS